MVCPLRFVLAGLSAAIVLFLAFDLLWGSGKDDLLLAGEVRTVAQMLQVICVAMLYYCNSVVVTSNNARMETARRQHEQDTGRHAVPNQAPLHQ